MRSNWVLWALGACALIAAVASLNALIALAIGYGWIPSGGTSGQEIGSTLASLQEASRIAAIATGILFIMWLHMAHERVEGLPEADIRYSRGWTIGGWFVPVANWIIPKQIVDDLWKSATPKDERWQVPPFYLDFWWITFVGGWIASIAGTNLFQNASSVSDIKIYLKLRIMHESLHLAAAVFAILLVGELTRRIRQTQT